jgi:Ca-activated chloride channel family protein
MTATWSSLQGIWTLSLPNGAIEIDWPWVLLAAPLPLLLTLFARPYRTRFEAVHLPFFDEIAHATGMTPGPGATVLRRSWLERAVGAVVWLALLLALARPQWVDPPVERIQPGRDMLLAVDISQSMGERDFADAGGRRIERLAAVKQVLDGFIASRRGDRIGLIVFGDAAYLQTPLTLDHELLRQLLASVQVGMAGPRTMIGDAVGLAIRLLAESDARHKVLIVLSDGNDTGSRVPPDTAARIARERGVTLHAVAIGDPATRGADKVSLATLRDIARLGGGRFAMGTDLRQLQAIYAELDALEKLDFKTLSYRAKHPLYHWPLGLAVALVLALQLLAAVTALVRDRRSHG